MPDWSNKLVEHLLSEGQMDKPFLFVPESWVAPGTEVRWFFTFKGFAGLGHPIPLLFTIAAMASYLVLVFLISPRLAPKTPAGKRTFQRIRYWHNVSMCLYSGVCTGASLWFLVANGELFDFQAHTCSTSVPWWLIYLNLTFVFSKIWEWIDTVMLVVAADGKFTKLNFLHVYHHLTTFVLFLLCSNLPGCMKMGLLLNGGVHTLMYAHYARPFPKPLVPMITVAQLMQLFYVTYMWTLAPSVCGGAFQRFAWVDYPVEFIVPYAMVPVYIIFFMRFFILRFVMGKSKAGGKKKEA